MCREREGVEGDKDRAQAAIGEVDESRSAHVNELKGLQDELKDLEARVEAKLREYTEIRDLAKTKGDQIDRLKCVCLVVPLFTACSLCFMFIIHAADASQGCIRCMCACMMSLTCWGTASSWRYEDV